MNTEKALQTLKQLLDTGVLTQQEYDTKVAQLTKKESQPNVDAALKALEELRNSGVLTEQEYQEKKAKLLNTSPIQISEQDQKAIQTLQKLRDSKVLTEVEYQLKYTQIMKKYQQSVAPTPASSPVEKPESKSVPQLKVQKVTPVVELSREQQEALDTLDSLKNKGLLSNEDYEAKKKLVYEKAKASPRISESASPRKGALAPDLTPNRSPRFEKKSYTRQEIEDAKMVLTIQEKMRLQNIKKLLQNGTINQEQYEERWLELMSEYLSERKQKERVIELHRQKRLSMNQRRKSWRVEGIDVNNLQNQLANTKL